MVGLLDDEAAALVSGNPLLPIVPLQERALIVLSHRAVSDVVVGAPLELTEGFLNDHSVKVVAVDPRSEAGGRYALPTAALACAEEAGLCSTPSLGPVVGAGEPGCGGHLTADGVLARLVAADAADGEAAEVAAGDASSLFGTSVVGSLPRPEFVR